MNRTLLILALNIFLCIQTRGAEPDKVAGARWDSTPAQVRQILGKRPGVAFEAETPEAVTFTGGTFAGFNAKSWRFTFTNGKVSEVHISISFKSGKDGKGWFADQDFEALQAMLVRKYGKARNTHHPNFEARSWEFRDSLAPTGAKTIELYRGWAGQRSPLEVTYTYARAKGIRARLATPKPEEDI